MLLQRRLRTVLLSLIKEKNLNFKKNQKNFEKLLTPLPAYVMLTALGGNMKKLETKKELIEYIEKCHEDILNAYELWQLSVAERSVAERGGPERTYSDGRQVFKTRNGESVTVNLNHLRQKFLGENRPDMSNNLYKDLFFQTPSAFDNVSGWFKKFARVSAKQAGAERVGQPLSTIMRDGHIEVKDAIIQNAEDWIVINPNGEAYIIKDEKFRKRYETSVGADGKHAPIADPQDFLLVPEDIEFMVPWGENGAPIPFTLKAGGYLNVTDLQNLDKKPISEIDIYGVQKEEFEQTYAPCSREGVFEDKKLRELFNQADRGEKQ